jgi:hypothetical protein
MTFFRVFITWGVTGTGLKAYASLIRAKVDARGDAKGLHLFD